MNKNLDDYSAAPNPSLISVRITDQLEAVMLVSSGDWRTSCDDKIIGPIRHDVSPCLPALVLAVGSL